MGDHTTAVTSDNWESEVMKSDLPVIVDLWADWCPPCRELSPVLEEFAGKFAGRVKVVKVDVQTQREIAGAFEVQSIPTIGVVYQGGLVGKVVGYGGRAQVEQLFERVAGLPEEVAKHEPEGGPSDA